MKERIKTIPDLLEFSPLHKEARALGDTHLRAWTFNVEDRFKGMSVEEIRKILQETSYPYAVCFENVIGDFNMGTGIRNANAFNAREVFYIGDKKWDRRAAVGVQNYHPVNWIASIDELISLQKKYVFVGVDNVPGSISITNYSYPMPCLLIFGEEGVGLTPIIQSLCKNIIHIDMYGSVRSLNCGTASGIAMFDLVSKINKSNLETL